MTFEELLDQAIALLQRRGRLTYRALKRQFDLDDAYLGACPRNNLSGFSGHSCRMEDVRR
jgi:hypothetical protein